MFPDFPDGSNIGIEAFPPQVKTLWHLVNPDQSEENICKLICSSSWDQEWACSGFNDIPTKLQNIKFGL